MFWLMSETTYLRCLCNHCSGPIEFPEEGIGQTVDCPHCGLDTILYEPPFAVAAPAATKIAEAAPPPIPHPQSATPTRKCPFCAELINLEAVKCRYCGEFLTYRDLNQSARSTLSLERPRIHPTISWRRVVIMCGIVVLGVLLLDTVSKATRLGSEGTENREANRQVITKKRHVTRSEFGSIWPFTVSEGDVYGIRLQPLGSLSRVAAIFESDGIKYGLNGVALQQGYLDVNSVRIGERIEGLVPEDTIYNYRDIGFLISLALEHENPSVNLAAGGVTHDNTSDSSRREIGDPAAERNLRSGAEWLLDLQQA